MDENRKFIIGTPHSLRGELKLKEAGPEEKTGYYEIDFCARVEEVFTALDSMGYDFLTSLVDSKLVFRKRS